VDWIELALDKILLLPLVNMIMDFGLKKKRGDSLSSWATVRFSRKTLLCGVGSLNIYNTV